MKGRQLRVQLAALCVFFSLYIGCYRTIFPGFQTASGAEGISSLLLRP